MSPRALTDAEAKQLQAGLARNIADAISASVTEFLSIHRERIPEREHMVALIVDLICEGKASRDVLAGCVAGAEELNTHPAMYDDVEEEARRAAEMLR